MSGSEDAAIILSTRGLGKKYARDLVTARHYGIADILGEFSPRRRRASLRSGEFWALHGIDITIPRGEALGIVGRNGSGKSTLLKVLSGIIRPDVGSVVIEGSHASLIDLGASHQSVLTGRENIQASAAVRGYTGRRASDLVEAVGEFSELTDVLDTPLRTYSAGMQMRLGFAIAAQLNPDVLFIDEVIAVGDIRFQRKCMAFLERFLGHGGSILMVSHDLWMIQSLCSRCLVMREGEVVDDESPNRAIASYLSQVRKSSGPSLTEPHTIEPVGVDTQNHECEIIDLTVQSTPDLPHRIWDDLQIQVTAHAPEGERLVLLRIEITTVDKFACIANVLGPVPDGPVMLGPRNTRIDCRLERLPLYGGEFLVSATLVDPTNGKELSAGATDRLDISIGNSQLDIMAQISPVLAGIDGEFTSPRHVQAGSVDQLDASTINGRLDRPRKP